MIAAPSSGVLRSAQLPSTGQAFGSIGAALVLLGVFLAPYTTWRPVSSLLFTVSDTVFCVGVFFCLAGRRLNIRPLGEFTPIWYIALAMLLAGFLLGSIINGDPERWIIVAAQYGFAFALLPSLMVCTRRDDAIRVSKALLAGVVAMELFGLGVYYWVSGGYLAAKRFGPEFITGEHRLGAFMADANWNAAMISMTIPFVLYLQRIRRIGIPTAVASTAILLIALLYSGSFTGFISAIASVGIFFLVSGSIRSLRLVFAMVAIGTAIMWSGVTLPPIFEKRVVGALQNQDLSKAGTYTGRLELIKEAWDIVDHTSLVGLGVDQYRVVSRDKAPVHNMYLLVWAEGGLLALLGWIVMILVPFAAGIRNFAYDRTAAGLGLAVFVAFFIFSMAAPHMYSRSWIVPVFAAIGITLTRQTRSDRLTRIG